MSWNDVKKYERGRRSWNEGKIERRAGSWNEEKEVGTRRRKLERKARSRNESEAV